MREFGGTGDNLAERFSGESVMYNWVSSVKSGS